MTLLSRPSFARLMTPKILAPIAFLVAGLFSVLIAWGASMLIERITASAVKSRLLTEGITWADVQADGLQVQLIGTAPNEAARYRVVNMIGTMVESSRVRDQLEVTPVKAVEAPRFSLEMLRNDDGIQLIGLMPAEGAEAVLVETAQGLMPDIPLLEMIETSSYPAPEGWDAAVAYGIEALTLLPRSKISVAADHVAITAIAASEAEKRSLETKLARAKPEGLQLKFDISAPRPVLTPFTLRFVKDAQGVRFDACAADSEQARSKILAAAGDAGMADRVPCTIGLGVPSPSWGDATVAGIKAVAALTTATVTFKDADVSLQVGSDVSQADFDRIVGELDAELPDVFSLDATLEKAATAAVQGPAEFTAALIAETGRVELRGRLTDETTRLAVDSFAKAEFGTGKVYLATRMDPELPEGWAVRVLAGLDALSQLVSGSVVVRADMVQVTGITGSQSAKTRISQILSSRLGQGQNFRVDVTYDEALDPLAALPTAEECAADVGKVLAKQKISFKPGSAEIDAAADGVMSGLADVLKNCPGVKMEIAGHTDSQGSEEGNRALSQARAEAVVVALQGRQVDVSGMVAKGYGEAVPLGDNETDLGREANRRIEFTVVGGAEAPAVAGDPDAAKAAATTPVGADGAPDFSADTSASVAPTDKTRRPKTRAEPSE